MLGISHLYNENYRTHEMVHDPSDFINECWNASQGIRNSRWICNRADDAFRVMLARVLPRDEESKR